MFVVHDDGPSRRLDVRWGLVPFWAKDPSIGNRMINARAETVAEKSALKRSLARRRCIIPADGFYEWTTEPGTKKKQPFYIHRPDGEPYVRRLWEEWKGPKDRPAPDAELPPVRAAALDDHHHDLGQRAHVGAAPTACRSSCRAQR